MRQPILVGIVEPTTTGWRDVAQRLRAEGNAESLELWLVLVGQGANQEAKQRCATFLGIEHTRVVIALGAPDPEADPRPLACYLLDTFVRMTGSRPIQALADPERPKTFAMLAEIAAVLRNWSLRLPGVGTLPRNVDASRRVAEILPRGLEQPNDILGDCSAIRQVRQQIARYGPLPWPVLVLGETGTGKELVADALHKASRREGRLVSVNAARLPDDRAAESELFGHVKGAYTGAERERAGRFREAASGTLFLDELPNLTPNLQGRLLRALNKAELAQVRVFPMGGSDSDEEPVEVRFVAAAQRDPREEASIPGTYPIRDDLYWRIATLVIAIPPLRERGDDITLLAQRVLEEVSATTGQPLSFDDEATHFLREHTWPGNVRELNTVVRRAWVRLERGEQVISREHLQGSVDGRSTKVRLSVPCELERELGRLGRQAIEEALQRTEGNHSAAGKLLGIKRDLARKKDKYTRWEQGGDHGE